MIRLKYDAMRLAARFNPRRIIGLVGMKGLLKALEIKLLGKHASTFCYNFPDTVYMEITNRCQLNCTYCYRHQPDLMNPDQGFMPYEKFVHIVDQIKGVRRLYLSMGGEPVLHKDMVRMLQYVSDNTIAKTFGFTTNGMLITPEVADKILATQPGFINVSFDSPDAGVLEKVRIGTDFRTLTDNIRYLAEYAPPGVRIEVNTVITADNLESLRTMPEFLDELGVPCLLTQQMIVRSGDMEDLSSDEPVELITLLTEKCRSLGIEFHYEPMLPKTICMWPFRSIGITWDGKITPCCYIETIGLNREPFAFEGMWNGGEMRKWRQDMLAMNYPEICYRYCTFKKKLRKAR